MNRKIESVFEEKKPLNLLDIEHEDWFDEFQRLEGNLTKCLLLVALMTRLALIEKKESTLLKKFLMQSSDQKTSEIVKTFERKASLYVLRSTLRGHLGLPRIRVADLDSRPLSPQHIMREENKLAQKSRKNYATSKAASFASPRAVTFEYAANNMNESASKVNVAANISYLSPSTQSRCESPISQTKRGKS